MESAILLLDNPTSANWRKWQKIYQERKTTSEKVSRPTEDELIKMSEEIENDPNTKWYANMADLKASLEVGD